MGVDRHPWRSSTSVAVRQDITLLGSGLALAHAIEMLIGWIAIQRLAWNKVDLGHPRILVPFTLLGIGLAPSLSGAVAAAVLETVQGTQWSAGFQIWWAAHALGMALFAPMAIVFHPSTWARTRRLLETPIFLPWLALVIVTLLVFCQSSHPILFMLFPPLLWMVFRWGFAGACMGAITTLGIALPMTYWGFGPLMLLADTTLANRFFFLQVFMGTALLVMFPIGMILDHRARLLAKLQARELELQTMAWHDPLTGLLNRRGFEQHLSTLRQSDATSMVLLDLDFFKGYNDTYGHPAGDEALIWVAGILRHHAKEAGGVASRQGGEEFAAALPLDLRQSMEWAEGVRKAMVQEQRPHQVSAFGHMTASFGVATVKNPVNVADIEPLLKTADKMLYLAKQSGRNRVEGAVI